MYVYINGKTDIFSVNIDIIRNSNNCMCVRRSFRQVGVTLAVVSIQNIFEF